MHVQKVNGEEYGCTALRTFAKRLKSVKELGRNSFLYKFECPFLYQTWIDDGFGTGRGRYLDNAKNWLTKEKKP